MKHIENVTLVAVATTEVEATVKAIEYSLNSLKFDKVKLFSHYNPDLTNTHYEFIEIGSFEDVGEWGKFVIFDLYKHIDTDYIILIHADGFIVNPESWDNDFLQYDYIGAPWPIPKDSYSYRDYFGNIIRVGNSVSLRSYNLLKAPSELMIDWSSDHGFFHEDGFVCVQHRHTLQNAGIKYAPLSVASRFSHEKPIPEIKGIKPFAFHKWEGMNKRYPRFTKKENFFIKIIRKMKKIKGLSNAKSN